MIDAVVLMPSLNRHTAIVSAIPFQEGSPVSVPTDKKKTATPYYKLSPRNPSQNAKGLESTLHACNPCAVCCYTLHEKHTTHVHQLFTLAPWAAAHGLLHIGQTGPVSLSVSKPPQLTPRA